MDRPTSLLLLTCFLLNTWYYAFVKKNPALLWKLINILKQLKHIVGKFSEYEYFFKADLCYLMYKMTQDHVQMPVDIISANEDDFQQCII